MKRVKKERVFLEANKKFNQKIKNLKIDYIDGSMDRVDNVVDRVDIHWLTTLRFLIINILNA